MKAKTEIVTGVVRIRATDAETGRSKSTTAYATTPEEVIAEMERMIGVGGRRKSTAKMGR